MLVLSIPISSISRMNKEVSLELHSIRSGMNHCQMSMRTQKQQHEQWTLSLDGDTSTTSIQFLCDSLPKFSSHASKLVSGSVDFVGINHYTTLYVRNDRMRIRKLVMNDASTDSATIPTAYRHGKRIGQTILLRLCLEKLTNTRGVCMAGMDDSNSPFSRLENVLQDDKRIQYHSDYMSNLLDAIRKEGCNVHGYFVWPLLDNWEWNSGYTVRFGLYYIKYDNNLTMIPKASVKWFSQFLAQKTAII
ncbi:hypothetical protein HU200_010146 [Digitaria exilis]|uniref:Beta-glucosidase n=1 Tax=Digitaria exilis TaxID=1010633 RepID=A0A835KMK0_9POAL|nr:hypothetical protein HU200_010146 [Digitaria exilis]